MLVMEACFGLIRKRRPPLIVVRADDERARPSCSLVSVARETCARDTSRGDDDDDDGQSNADDRECANKRQQRKQQW